MVFLVAWRVFALLVKNYLYFFSFWVSLVPGAALFQFFEFTCCHLYLFI